VLQQLKDQVSTLPGRFQIVSSRFFRVKTWTAASVLVPVVLLATISLANTIRPKAIVVHHTALTNEDILEHPGPVTVSTVDGLHEKRGYGAFYWWRIYHIGYHYLILPDGTLQKGRPEHCIGAHTRGHNDAIGICLVGNFSSIPNASSAPTNSEPTEQQLKTLTLLIRDIVGRYKIPCNKIFRHRDLNPRTECPGEHFPWEKLRNNIGCNL
jgi:N-acetylmuramoyl-L-alanine amidase